VKVVLYWREAEIAILGFDCIYTHRLMYVTEASH
jgi:hypothetical protein